MLTLLASLVQSVEDTPFIADPFIRMPSLFTLVDMVGTAYIGWALWRLYRQRQARGEGDGEEGVTQQQYRRLVARLDAFEHSASEREKSHESFRRDVIDANDKSLEAQRRGNNLLEALVSRTDYVARTLDGRPCVLNEATNGDEDCPEGQE